MDYRVPSPRAIAMLTGEACKAVRRNPQLARAPEPTAIIARFTDDATIYEVRFYADPEKIEPTIAQSIVASAVHEVVLRTQVPNPVTQIEITPAPTLDMLHGTKEGRDALPHVPLFAQVLTDAQFDSLNANARHYQFAAGKPFIRQGESATSMYVLL